VPATPRTHPGPLLACLLTRGHFGCGSHELSALSRLIFFLATFFILLSAATRAWIVPARLVRHTQQLYQDRQCLYSAVTAVLVTPDVPRASVRDLLPAADRLAAAPSPGNRTSVRVRRIRSGFTSANTIHGLRVPPPSASDSPSQTMRESQSKRPSTYSGR